MSRRVPVPVIALIVGLLIAATAVSGLPVSVTGAQADEYEISIANSITVPERTVSVDGDSYTVDALASRAPGDSLVIDVAAPDGQEYDLYLYNRKIQIQQSQPMTGTDSAEFVTDDLRPSTYFVAVYYDGAIQEIYPLVITGYELSMTVPDSVTRGETATVSVDVTRTDDRMSDPPRRVQVVLGNESTSLRINATQEGGSYVAEVPTDSLSPGSYATYSVVRGENETKGGNDVLLGVSDRYDLTIESTATSTPTPTDGSGSSGGDGDTGGGTSDGGTGGGGTDPSTATPTSAQATATETPTTTPTPTSTSAESPTTTETPTPTPTPTVSPTPTPTPTDDGVITPVTPTSPGGPETTTTTSGQPGFGVIVAGGSLLAGALLLTRRRAAD